VAARSGGLGDLALAKHFDFGAERGDSLIVRRVLPGSEIPAQTEKTDRERGDDDCWNGSTSGHT
jgi:hypothetical protein